MSPVGSPAPRILLAGIFHETHTFVDEPTPLDDFTILRGDELLKCRGDASPLGAALDAARDFGWHVVPAIDVRASPSGIVPDAVVETFWTAVESTLRKQTEPLDGVLLVLHGAMVSQSQDDVEGEMLRRLRAAPACADVPIFGVFDLHASFSPAMARHADCLTAYRENPHADAAEAARRAATLLERALRDGQRPRMVLRHAGVMWPPGGTGTADSPMRDLEALAREIEAQDPDIWSIDIVGGFAFADVADAGVSLVVATSGYVAQAERYLDRLSELAQSLREVGNQIPPPVDEVLDQLRSPLAGLTVIAEPSDNIGGGAPGDGTGLMRALIERRIAEAAVCLNDPQAVAALQAVEVGDRVTLALGGRGSRFDAGPLELDVELMSRGDGRFQLEDRQSHLASMSGAVFDMGPTAVVRHAGLTILLTSRRTPPFDLGQWRSQGIEPTRMSVIGVKAAVAHRRAYLPIAARMWSVDTPGPCTSDLRRLPYRKIRRPIYPLDV